MTRACRTKKNPTKKNRDERTRRNVRTAAAAAAVGRPLTRARAHTQQTAPGALTFGRGGASFSAPYAGSYSRIFASTGPKSSSSSGGDHHSVVFLVSAPWGGEEGMEETKAGDVFNNNNNVRDSGNAIIHSPHFTHTHNSGGRDECRWFANVPENLGKTFVIFSRFTRSRPHALESHQRPPPYNRPMNLAHIHDDGVISSLVHDARPPPPPLVVLRVRSFFVVVLLSFSAFRAR